MVIKYNAEIDNEIIIKNIDRITNQVFKLLPLREEGGNWETPLKNLILEVVGVNQLIGHTVDLFSLLCKMEALLTLNADNDFMQFRTLIFECLTLLNEVKKCL